MTVYGSLEGELQGIYTPQHILSLGCLQKYKCTMYCNVSAMILQTELHSCTTLWSIPSCRCQSLEASGIKVCLIQILDINRHNYTLDIYEGGATNLKVGGVNTVKELKFEKVGCMNPQLLLWRRPWLSHILIFLRIGFKDARSLIFSIYSNCWSRRFAIFVL